MKDLTIINGNQKSQVVLMGLVGINTALLVASNAAGAKMIALPGSLTASATVFSYALSFLFTDIISELYGRRSANFAVRIAFLGLFLSVIFFSISIAAPAACYWDGQRAYEKTLGLGPRILAGGWAAYMISQHFDVWIFHKLKQITNSRHLWLRNNGSTLISQFIDTIIFIPIAFYGVFPIGNAIIGQYIVKMIIAVIDTPLIYMSVAILKGKVGLCHEVKL